MKLSKKELSLLKIIFRSTDGLDIGALTWKHGISINEAFQTFSSLKAKDMVAKSGYTLKLTSQGRNWVMENQSLFAYEGNKEWRSVPKQYLGNRIDVFQPYVPRRSMIDKKGLLHRVEKKP